jgi:hypothetical protein
VSIKKKVKARIRATAKKPGLTTAAKKRPPKKKKGKDIVEVRENINELVKASAKTIANKVIEVAKTGQLASAKYLFEAIGLYPATEQTAPTPVTGSLAHTLLTRMGLPTEPVIRDEEEAPVPVMRDVTGAIHEVVRETDEDSANGQGHEQESGVEKVAGEPAE